MSTPITSKEKKKVPSSSKRQNRTNPVEIVKVVLIESMTIDCQTYFLSLLSVIEKLN